MSVSSIPDYVDKYVLVEPLPIVDRNLHRLVNKLWLVPVYVNNWRLDRLCYIGAVQSCSGLGGGSCESDLVVCDDVDHAIKLVVL